MQLEQFLTAHLRQTLEKHRVLTVYDEHQHLAPVVQALAQDTCTLITVDDDVIATREQALTALQQLGTDESLRSQLLVYIPRVRPLAAQAVCMDPFTPLVLAGGVFPDGAGDSFLSLCQRFLPEQTGLLEDMFKHGAPSFAEVNSLVVGAGGAPVLSGLLRGEGTLDLMVRFLCIGEKEAGELKRSSNWRKELQTLVKKVLGLDLPEEQSDVNELRRLIWRFVLFSEFVADLPAELPAALRSITKAEPKYHRFVFDLCEALRDRTSTQQTYEEQAMRVAEELSLEQHCGTMEDLGQLDTFAFEERCFLAAYAKAALADDLDRAEAMVKQRSRSFWIRDAARAAEWKAAGCCVDLLHSVTDLRNVVEVQKPLTATAYIDLYVQHGHKLDAAHRILEQIIQDTAPEPGPLNDVLQKARSAHRDQLDRMVRSFQDAVAQEGWPTPGRERANDVYERYVRTAWQEGKRVAYIWVDAFRYDLALHLAQQVGARHEATVRPVCAQLPSITKIGMAALLPGAGEDFRMQVQGNDLVPVVKGQPIPDLQARRNYLTEAVGRNRFATMELPDLLANKDLQSLKQVEVLHVHTAAIDQLGENNPSYLAGLIPSAMFDLQRALNRLADAGFQTAVLATDHGFCLFDSAGSGDAIPKPLDGEWLEVKNRALLGNGQPNAQVVCVEASHMGIRGPVERYVAARGLATFTKGVRYFHEGLSPQECVLPVVVVQLKAAARKNTTPRLDVLLTYRGANKGTVSVLRPSVEVSVPAGEELFPVEVQFILEGVSNENNKVARSAPDPRVDAATGIVSVNAGQSIKLPINIEPGFEGTFQLRAVNPGTGEILGSLELTTAFHH
jgi:hypothetical protein